jgi:GNAT superfamily N-acetyltransferase
MTEAGSQKLRRLRAEDIPLAAQLSAQAGWNQTEEDWRTLLELSPEGCLAIEVNGHLAATTTLLCYGRRLAWIGMVLTRAEYQRRGLARRLLAQALEIADKMGIATIKLDATAQGRHSTSLGFRNELEIERWSRPAAAVQLPSRPNIGGGTEARLDSFGVRADRSQLLETHNSTLKINLAVLSIFRPGACVRVSGTVRQRESGTARHMIEECVQNARCGWSWDLFQRNQDAMALARDLGFSPQRHLVRMTRGEELCDKENAIYAIAGFELG